MKSKVSEKGQVTIPRSIRDRLGIRPGQEVEFTAEGGRIVLKKVVKAMDPVAAVYGTFKDSVESDALIEELRGPVDTVDS